MVECVFVLCTTFALVIKTNSIMKEIKNVEKGENFTTVNVGKLNEIKEYELAMGNFSIPRKDVCRTCTTSNRRRIVFPKSCSWAGLWHTPYP